VFPVSDVPAAGRSIASVWVLTLVGFGENLRRTPASAAASWTSILTLEPSDAGSGEAYVELRGVDAYYEELRARNVELGELHDRPYGMRDFALIDLDGNRLVFGEPTVE
jgi:hypothetical protein